MREKGRGGNASEGMFLKAWTSGDLAHFHVGHLRSVVSRALPGGQLQGEGWGLGTFVLINVRGGLRRTAGGEADEGEDGVWGFCPFMST